MSRSRFIGFEEWIGCAFDFENDLLTRSVGSTSYGSIGPVEISQNDLQDWLRRNHVTGRQSATRSIQPRLVEKTSAEKMSDSVVAADAVAKCRGDPLPSVKEHTTLTMAQLKLQFPGNHAKRADVEKVIKTRYAGRRLERGNPHKARR
jgi:hypothetical protein